MKNEIDARYEAVCFDEFSTDFSELWLYLTIVPCNILTAWAGAIAVGIVSGLARWQIYPRFWSWAPFNMVKSLILWLLCGIAAWHLWFMGARTQAITVLLNRIFLRGLLGGMISMLVDIPLAQHAQMGHPHRLFFQRFFNVADGVEPAEAPTEWLPRLLKWVFTSAVLSAIWVSIMIWIGK